ncbi:hypothetical protein P43SY_002377 [Pythium insidiosum]|uniref:Protein kinase domain-containing protein n=1 Tax=Pythium insidiosum TaxID=114742 RepID=A0AAD5M9G0_PYTIN|nr:hypothetical protein P43SY_002377 [Pythium insidiosum]
MMEADADADAERNDIHEKGDAGVELQPKRTTSFATRFKNNKKPGAPGAVVLSHLLVLFYAYCWMGPWPIKRWRTVRLFYLVYGFLCFIWWGAFGTSQAASATSSGFQSCLSTSPALYIFAQFQVAVFWIFFLLAIGYFVRERVAEKREAKLTLQREKRMEALREKLNAEADARDREQKVLAEEARRKEEIAKKLLDDEQDRLFRDSEGDNQQDNDDEDAEALAEDPEEEIDDGREDDDDAEEEEVTITVCGNVFRLVETIGRGSYGTVHKAINLSSGAAVAVKLIGKDKIRRPHERRSIEKEIETMRVAVEQFENGHPHIVRLLCTKESQQHIYIVLEYCAGGDLAAVMKSTRGLAEEQARVYMSQLASGLQFLRSQNVVHRDLKPANLLLSSKNQANAKLKIADFGFARELQSESLAESVVGSPLYMAPELLEYKSYDAKADLWSVGIILYEMLANDHPFLVVDNFHATNHLALRRNIQRYFERYGNALVAEDQPDQDWGAFSDEYVIVDKEYEDVGRRILNQNDLNTGLGAKRLDRAASSGNAAATETTSTIADDNRLEELLGICYKSFSCGSVGLFVPTPFGDYIAFHEGCPHYYLSVESIEAFKHDGRNPPYVLGCIVFIEDFVASAISHLALFFLKGGKLPYVAFNEGAPNYFLANESIQAARAGDADDKSYPTYILGEIIFIDTFQATEDFNPYRLPYGTRFHVVTVSNPKRT